MHRVEVEGSRGEAADAEMSATESQLINWVEPWPITNQCTHYVTSGVDMYQTEDELRSR